MGTGFQVPVTRYGVHELNVSPEKSEKAYQPKRGTHPLTTDDSRTRTYLLTFGHTLTTSNSPGNFFQKNLKKRVEKRLHLTLAF